MSERKTIKFSLAPTTLEKKIIDSSSQVKKPDTSFKTQ